MSAGFHGLQGQPPAGQGFRVAVQDPDPPATHAGGEVAGQLAQAPARNTATCPTAVAAPIKLESTAVVV
jgi:hypothetical protein